MARGRKSTKVKNITGRDSKLLMQLAKTGIAAHDQVKHYCGINEDRLAKLEKSKFIKTSIYAVEGIATKIIQLDKVGKEYCKENYLIDSFCQAQTNHLTHDLRLTEMYYTLETNVQKTWTHERDLINEIYESNPELKGNLQNCVDARIEVNGEFIAIESIGDSYSKEDISIKNEIATNILNCSRMEAF